MHKFIMLFCFTVLISNYGVAQANVVAQTINGIPQADQFAGADMCDKINAAAIYAISKGIGQVDATHFSGTQVCNFDPLTNLAPAGSPLPLTINLGAVHIVTSVQWEIQNSLLRIQGMGASVTLLEYGATPQQPSPPVTPAIILISTGTPSGGSYVEGVQLSDMTIYGDSADATDAILLQAVHHSEFKNLHTWGVTGCGIHSEYAVTDTFYRPRTSIWDAIDLGINNSAHTVPAHGLCFGGLTIDGENLQTTDGTVVDASAENLTGTGWLITDANSMTFTSGTSETNAGGGIEVDSPSSDNTFEGTDLEANGGNNFTDNGASTALINVIMDKQPTVIGSQSIGFSERGGNETSPLNISPSAQYPAYSFGNIDYLGRIVIDGLRIGPDTRPTITSSVGGPTGTCQSGSLYLNAAGGTGTTLYVCESSSWVAK